MATWTRRLRCNWRQTGVAASLYVTVYNGSNTAVVARAAVTGEFPASSGWYYKDVTWDNSWTSPWVLFDDGTSYEGETDAVGDVAKINGAAASPGVSPGGSGADSVTLTITVLGVPLADADVWVTSDAAGTTVVAGTSQTDSNGQITFLLDAGDTYYMWAQKDGYMSIQGESFVAVAD